MEFFSEEGFETVTHLTKQCTKNQIILIITFEMDRVTFLVTKPHLYINVFGQWSFKRTATLGKSRILVSLQGSYNFLLHSWPLCPPGIFPFIVKSLVQSSSKIGLDELINEGGGGESVQYFYDSDGLRE